MSRAGHACDGSGSLTFQGEEGRRRVLLHEADAVLRPADNRPHREAVYRQHEGDVLVTNQDFDGVLGRHFLPETTCPPPIREWGCHRIVCSTRCGRPCRPCTLCTCASLDEIRQKTNFVFRFFRHFLCFAFQFLSVFFNLSDDLIFYCIIITIIVFVVLLSLFIYYTHLYHLLFIIIKLFYYQYFLIYMYIIYIF